MQGPNFLEEISTVFTQTSSCRSILSDLLSSSIIIKVRNGSRTLFDRAIIVRFLAIMKLIGLSNIHTIYERGLDKLIPFVKDVMYNTQNSPWINWRRLLSRSAVQAIKGVTMNNENSEAWVSSCFILDDTDLPKRGKCMELIGRIFSHVTMKYPLGYKCFNLAIWSGKHLVHIDFSFHLELGKNKDQGLSKKERARRYCEDRPKGSHASSRVQEAYTTKITSAVKMMTRALKIGIRPSYVLANSRFFCNKLIEFATKNNLHFISRPKKNNWKYTHEGKEYTIGSLIKKLCRRKIQISSRKINIYTMTTSVHFKNHNLKLYFYKTKKRGSKWNCLISTDNSMTAIQAWRIYKNRWAIEVSYKELKQNMEYGKCQSKNFASQIADATVSLMTYTLLSHYKTIHEYESIGPLFQEVSQTWIVPNLMLRFWNEFYEALKQLAEQIEQDIDWIMEKLISNRPFVKSLNLFCAKISAET